MLPAHNDTVNRLRNLTAASRKQNKRLIYQCHYTNPVPRLVAAFLIGAGDDHYFTVGGWGPNSDVGFPGHWSPLFEHPLGEPVADALYDAATGEWTRSFASGTNVSWNAIRENGTIRWASV